MKDVVLIEAASKSTYQRKYKCPYCEQKFERNKLHIHIQNKHEEQIPEGYTALRVAFNTINNKTEGHCIMCGKVSDWNEDKGRYERLCNDPKCHEAYKKMAAERNKNKYGVERLQSDPRYAEEVQRKAMQGRRIAGKYKFPDGTEIDYLGAYERRFLEFMDKVMNCKAEDIAAPGPTIKYAWNGAEHLYISDFYYIPYNLIVEIKDGGDNPNNNPAIRGYRVDRQKAKEAAVEATGKYNYIRLTNNDFGQLMSIMAVLKYNLQNDCYDPIMRINEMTLLESTNNNELSNLINICKQLSTYEYILVDKNKNIEYNTARTNWDNHRTLSVSDFIKCHGGICYDYVNYEVTKVKAKFKTFFTGFVKNNQTEATHTYLLAYIDDYVYWLECSWKIHIGVYKFNSEDEAISYIVNTLRRDNMEDFTVEYKPNSSLVGISINDFIGKMIDLPDYRYKNIKNPKCENIYKVRLDNNGNIIEEKTKSLNESILFNEKDIYYNKDKFNSGEINLCFIAGLSGSGKSTMGRDMTMKNQENVDWYSLDDLQCVADHFTMQQLKEYGDLIYSYFKGPGKKFYITWDELKEKNIPGSEYEDKLFPGFVHYAMQYAKSHKDKKFVIEGVWLYNTDGEDGKPWFRPEEFKDYAFYIKGTSMIVSKWRAAKRDAEDNDNSFDRLRYSSKDFFFKNWKWYIFDEKRLNEFRKYFKKIIINESILLYESDDISKLDKNFKHKSGIDFDIIDIRDNKVKGNIDEIKGKYKDYFKGFAAFEKRTNNFAGFIRIWPNWILEEKYHGNLISPVEVKPKYRGYGLGRLLVEKAMEKYNANMLMVAKDNEVAINMYKKLGFSIDQDKKWKNEDYYIMITNNVKMIKSTNESVLLLEEDMSKYERPYTYQEIVENYGKEIADRLMKDPAHRWRAQTGIELIHKEPSLEELNRIWKNWNYMTDDMKNKSDKKSYELFNLNNKDNYNKLKKEYINESTNMNEDMSGTIGAALAPTANNLNIIKPMPLPTPYSDPDNYYLVTHPKDNKLSYSITKDPLQYTLYSVDPQEKGFYKVFKSDKGKISKNYLTFKIKDKRKAKELYENLVQLYNRNLTFIDHGLTSDINENYIYSYLTNGNNIISSDQILFDTRFELVRSFEESINYESTNLYNYLLHGSSTENKLNTLSEQVKELEEIIYE